ncbi:MAG: hypothetical protein LHW48_02115 [Candidatus Cloacimonetes bacterium]|nr:hypothetical protein [Candidatus Cloacimonadota bacterium]
MKQSVLITVITILMATLFAQEGEAYRGLQKAYRKTYVAKQKYGRNVLSLATQSTCFYDSQGNIIEEYHMQANRTYKGKTIKNICIEPSYTELLQYNHMNLLSSRSVEYTDAQTHEATTIEYDAKGKIIKKTSIKSSESHPELWELHYNQVGYIASYFKVILDSSAKISQKKLYDFKDDLLETHIYSYDDNNNLVNIIALSPEDTVLFRKEYYYNDIGCLIEKSKYNEVDAITESIHYAYNDNRRLILQSEYLWNPRFGTIPNLTKQIEYVYE